MRKRWKVWATGLTLVLLLTFGLGAALLWPVPSEAERWATKVEIGMLDEQAACSLNSTDFLVSSVEYADGSMLSLRYDSENRVAEVRTMPSVPAHPLTRLRRTLARMLPLLGD